MADSDNDLLARLDPATRAALSAVPVQLRPKEVLHEPGGSGGYIYFPATAVISLVSKMESGASAEIALVGREGMVGLAAMLGGTTDAATTAVVQIPGSAFRVSTGVLRAARLRWPALR